MTITMAVEAVTGFVGAIVAEVATNVAAHARPLAAYTAGWFVLTWVLEVVGPRVAPRLYGAINPDGKMSDRAVAKDMRTKLLCSGMAVWAVGCCIYGLLSPAGRAMWGHLYATNALTEHLVHFGASFFVWDIVICVLDGEAAAYHFHAWACFLTFAFALVRCLVVLYSPFMRTRAKSSVTAPLPPNPLQHPFSHYMSLVVLLFEASTPFLHARKFMLQARLTDGAWATPFMLVQVAFAGGFFLSRIMVGYTLVGLWAADLWAGLQAGTLHNPAVARLYLAMAVALSSLNAFWFSQIARAAMRRGSDGTRPPVNLADDLTAAIDGDADVASPTAQPPASGKAGKKKAA